MKRKRSRAGRYPPPAGDRITWGCVEGKTGEAANRKGRSENARPRTVPNPREVAQTSGRTWYIPTPWPPDAPYVLSSAEKEEADSRAGSRAGRRPGTKSRFPADGGSTRTDDNWPPR